MVGLLSAIAFALGYAGFSIESAQSELTLTPLDRMYRTAQLFTLESGAVPPPVPWQLEIARALAPSMAGYAALQALAVLFNEELKIARLRLMRRHIIVCGLGNMGFRLASALQDEGEQVVVIEADENNSHIDDCRALGQIVRIADATVADRLTQAGVLRARHLVSTSGDDRTNLLVAARAKALVHDGHGKLTSTVHVADPGLWHLLGGREVEANIDGFRLQFFNLYELGARAMLALLPELDPAQHPSIAPTVAPELEISGVPPDSTQVDTHVVLLGGGHLGRSLITELARRWWVHLRRRTASPRFRISLVDFRATGIVEELQRLHVRLQDACTLTAIDVDVLSIRFTELGWWKEVDRHPVTAVAVCFDDVRLAWTAALTIATEANKLPMAVRVPDTTGLSSLIHGEPFRGPDADGEVNGAAAEWRECCLHDVACDTRIALGGSREVLARAIHGDRMPEGRDHDGHAMATFGPWQELSEDARESFRRQADALGRILKATRHHLVRLRDWDADLHRFDADCMDMMARMHFEQALEDRSPSSTRGQMETAPPDPMRQADAWDQLEERLKERHLREVSTWPRVLAVAGLQVVRGSTFGRRASL